MKQLTVIVLLFFAVCVNAQEIKMSVHLTDQSILSFDIDSISKLEFSHTDTFPHYSVMYVTPPNATDMEYHRYETLPIDSFTFEYSNFAKRLHVFGDTSQMPFKLVGTYSFSDPPIDSIFFNEFAFDTNIVTLGKAAYSYRCSHPFDEYGDFHSVLWSGNYIHSTSPYRYFEVDSSYRITMDSIPCPTHNGGVLFDIHPNGNKLLEIIHTYRSEPVSYLFEYDRLTNTSTRLLPDDTTITAAKYLNADSIIFFSSYGPLKTLGAYFLLNRVTGEKTLLLSSDSNAWPHTFDLSSDGKKLLASSVGNHDPFLIEYDLATLKADTLYPDLGHPFYTIWLQYNYDGSKILYNIHPPRAAYGDAGYTEIGIIDRQTLAKKMLDVSVDNEWNWVSIFPSWSPDERTIVFSTGIGSFFPGTVGWFDMCILKSLE